MAQSCFHPSARARQQVPILPPSLPPSLSLSLPPSPIVLPSAAPCLLPAPALPCSTLPSPLHSMVPAPSLVSACTVPLVRTRPGQEAGGYHASRLARHVASHSAGHPSTFPPRFALQHSSSRPRGSLPNDHAEAFAYLTHIHRNLYSRPVRVPEEDATADSGPAGLVQALANWCSSRSLHASGVPGAPAERPPRPRPPPRSSSHSPFLRAGHGTR